MARATALAIEPLLDAASSARRCACSTSAAGSGDAVAAAAAARGAHVTGVDLAAGMLAEARRRHPAIEFVHGDAEELPFADGAFDVALGAFIVNHLPDPERGRRRAASASPAASRWRCGARRTRSRSSRCPPAPRPASTPRPAGPDGERFADRRRARRAARRRRSSRGHARPRDRLARRALGRRPRRHRPHRRPPRRRHAEQHAAPARARARSPSRTARGAATRCRPPIRVAHCVLSLDQVLEGLDGVVDVSPTTSR